MYEYFKNMEKDMIYEYYQRIVDDPSSYEKLDIKKMIEQVLKQYSYKKFLYYICSSKELEFLDKILNNNFDEEQYLKYSFEIRTLNNKFILDSDKFCIFTELLDYVKEAVKLYKESGAYSDYYIYTIGILKILGTLPFDVFKNLCFKNDNLSKKESDERFELFISNPFFKYYTCIYDVEDETSICYAPYYDFIDEIIENRKKFSNLGSISLDKNLLEEIFYYGFPVHLKKVKKMYDFVNENIPYLMDYVDEARALYDYSVVERFLSDDKAKDIITAGLEYCPSCTLYGLSPNEYSKQMVKSEDLNDKINNQKQINAHLSTPDADEFFDIYFALLEYTNKKYNINDLKKIYKKLHLDQEKVLEISDYMFDNVNIIDDFIKENPYNFDDEMLKVTKGFKNFVKSQFLMVVGFDREYTKILSEYGKLYMVKGLRNNIDNVISAKEVPTLISTTLIMFKDKIVYCGLLKTAEVRYDNFIIETILHEADNAIKYYHL